MKTYRTVVLIVTIFFGSVVAQVETQGIEGTWRYDSSAYPIDLIFDADGKFDIDAPGMVTGVEMRYEFDTSGAPAELRIYRVDDDSGNVRRLWVDFLSEDMIQLREQESEYPTLDFHEMDLLIFERVN